MVDIKRKEYKVLAYAINNIGKPRSREKILGLVRVLDYSRDAPKLGYMPDDLIRKTVMTDEDLDVLTARVNNAINWAVQDGELKSGPDNPDLILPKHAPQ